MGGEEDGGDKRREVRRHESGGETMNTDEKSGGSREFVQVELRHQEGVSPVQSCLQLCPRCASLLFHPYLLFVSSMWDTDKWEEMTLQRRLEPMRRRTDGGIQSVGVEDGAE